MERKKRLITHMTINASAKMFHCNGFRATFLLLKLQKKTISTSKAVSSSFNLRNLPLSSS